MKRSSTLSCALAADAASRRNPSSRPIRTPNLQVRTPGNRRQSRQLPELHQPTGHKCKEHRQLQLPQTTVAFAFAHPPLGVSKILSFPTKMPIQVRTNTSWWRPAECSRRRIYRDNAATWVSRCRPVIAETTAATHYGKWHQMRSSTRMFIISSWRLDPASVVPTQLGWRWVIGRSKSHQNQWRSRTHRLAVTMRWGNDGRIITVCIHGHPISEPLKFRLLMGILASGWQQMRWKFQICAKKWSGGLLTVDVHVAVLFWIVSCTFYTCCIYWMFCCCRNLLCFVKIYMQSLTNILRIGVIICAFICFPFWITLFSQFLSLLLLILGFVWSVSLSHFDW